MNATRLYYNAPYYVFRYLFMSLCLWGLLFSGFQAWQLRFFYVFPGNLFVYAICLWVSIELIKTLPCLFYSVLRIPAVEFRDGLIVVRSWSKRVFDTKSAPAFFSLNHKGTQLWIYTNKSNTSLIDFAHVDGQRTLIESLRHVAEERPNKH